MVSSPSPSSSSPSGVLRAYLFVYNVLSLLGWLYVWLSSVCHVYASWRDGVSPVSSLYDSVSFPLMCVQTLAVLEVFHAAVGAVRSPVLSAAMQVSSRLLLVWGILYVAPPSRASVGVFLLVLSWASTEIPRYAFYAYNVYSVAPAPLTWLRYSTFLVLYPTGITGELLCIAAALPYVRDHSVLSVSLPNAWNVSFDYHTALYGVIAFYVYGSYFMYTHMLKQRRKALSKNTEKKQH